MDALWREVRQVLRSLVRDAGLSAAAIATLAVGLGMNLAVFSVVNTILLRPFAFPEQDRLVILWEQDLTRDAFLHEVSWPNFRDWKAQNSSFEEMAAMGSTFWGRTRFVGQSEPFSGVQRAVSYSFFDALGVAAAHGRTFLPEDDAAGATRVAVVSHRFWRSWLGGEPAAIGQSFPVEGGEPITVVGVMPPEFDYPRGTDLWTAAGPVLAAVAERPEWAGERARSLDVLFVVGRLKPGVSLEKAESEMTGIARRLHEEYSPPTNIHQSVHVVPLVEHVLGNTRPALFALWGAVVLVLLLACSNVAGLLLVRAAARTKEHALRLALGAGRLRFVRPVLLEAGLLAVSGATAGLLLAEATLRLLIRSSPVEIPRLEDVRLDSHVFTFAMLLVALTVALVSLAPAVRLKSPALTVLLAGAVRGATESRRGIELRRWLVTGQIALAFMLLLGASLMARSLFNLLDVELGFEPRNLLTFDLSLPDDKYPSHEDKRAFYREVLQRIESLPGVVGVAGTSNRPFRGDEIGNDWTFYVEGQTEAEREQNPRAIGMVVTTNYFRTMNLRLLRGRAFGAQDDARAGRVIVVSERLARQAWPGQNPLGRRLCCGWAENGENPWLTVVGVVENARYRDIHEPRLDLYEHYLQGWSTLGTFLVRARSDPALLAEPVRAELSALDAERAIETFSTMEAVMSRVYAPWRFNMVSFGVFAMIALGMAGLGLFGLLAFDVRRRMREIGIRIALGATRERILTLVMGEVVGVILAGASLGIVGGVALTRALAGLLYGTGVTTAATYVIVTSVLLLATLLATYLPARRAVRVDPAVSLRQE